MRVKRFPFLLSPVSYATIAACVWAIFVIQLTPPEIAKAIAVENGPLENTQLLLYGMAVLVAAFQFLRRPTWPWLSGTAMTLWAYLRELDFQKAYTYRSVESFGFYLRPVAPWWQKILALLLYMPFIVAGFYLLLFSWKHWRTNPSQRQPWFGHILGIILLAIGSIIFEKIELMTVGEETCEAGMAFLTLAAALEFKKQTELGGTSP